MITEPTPSKFKPYTRQTIFLARQWQWMSADQQEAVQVLSHLLPFRTNQFILDRLIDWHKVPDDPIFRLTFPQRDMLPAEEYAQLRELVLFKKDEAAIGAMTRRIRMRMHPHRPGPAMLDPAALDDATQRGFRHKYAESLRFFPAAAQTCYAHCTCCARRSPVSTMDAMTLDPRALARLAAYLRGFLEARNPDWKGRPFHARFDPGATRIDQLVPAFGHGKFFFETTDTGVARQPKVIPVVPAAGRDARVHDAWLELA